MKDNPYDRLSESLYKVLVKLANMIFYLAERTLSKKEYEDFIDKFT